MLRQCAFLLFLLGCGNCVIEVKDQGYVGLVVDIDPSIPERNNTLDNLKNLISTTSEFLHRATRQRLYIKNVTIVVPSTWSKKPEYETVSGDPSADFRVVKSASEQQEYPHAKQPYGCGEQGASLTIPENFVENFRNNTMLPGHRMVHEWAHFRYGVFDEHGYPQDEKYPMIYFEGGVPHPNACTQKKLSVTFLKPDKSPCDIIEGRVQKHDCCCFEINEELSLGMRASIMFLPILPTVKDFCDNSDLDTHKHVIEAPNMHNTKCKRRSTWSVILDHPDFKNSPDKPVTLQKTNFRFVQSENPQGRYVLVLDVSGSMNKNGKLQSLHLAATQLIEDRLLTGSELSIVTFATNANIITEITVVNATTRPCLRKALPTKAEGNTAIGKGLQEALKALSQDGKNPAGGVIILMTDGEENVDPRMKTVLPDLVAKKVLVSTLAIGNQISEQLENLATFTGGRSYAVTFLNASNVEELRSKFFSAILSTKRDELKPIVVVQKDLSANTLNATFFTHIDREIGKETAFIASGEGVSSMMFSVTSPSGKTYTPEYDPVLKRKSVLIDRAEPGPWMITYSSSNGPKRISFSTVSNSVNDSTQPIRMSTLFSRLRLENQRSEMRLCTEIKKGPFMVINAEPYFEVERPSGDKVKISAKDDGLGADTMKNDGFYCSYFTQFNMPGRYSVRSYVKSDGKATIHQEARATQNPWLQDSSRKKRSTENSMTETEYKQLEAFERFEDAGSFKLDDYDKMFHFAPETVEDFLAIDSWFQNGQRMVNLSWTAPGGQLDVGNCTEYELRGSLTAKPLYGNFSQVYRFSETDVISGSLQPLSAGQKQTVVILIPNHPSSLSHEPTTSHDIYFALKSWNEHGKQSDVSNLATANFIVPSRQRPAPSGFNRDLAILSGSIGGAILTLAFIGGVVFFLRERKRKRMIPKEAVAYSACPQK